MIGNNIFVYKFMKPTHVLYALIVAWIWATAYFFHKALMSDFPVYCALTIEGSIISLMLIPFFPKMIVSWQENCILAFIWSILTYGSILLASKLGIDASVAVVVGKFNVVCAIIFSVIFCKEHLPKKAIIGLCISFVGLLFLLRTPNVLENPLAFCFMLVFAVSWGMYNTYIKILGVRYGKSLHPAALMAWVALFSIPQSFLVSLIFEDWSTIVINTSSIVALLFLAIFATCLALIIWAYLIQNNPMHKVGPFALLVPVIGLLEAWVFSEEIITVFHIISSIFIVSGVLIAVTSKEKNIYMKRL